jgi:hypothetical protein
MREEKGLGVAKRERREGSSVHLGGGDRVGCGPSTLVREGGFPPRILGATQVASPALAVSSLGAGSLELALVGLGWEVQGKHTGREGKRKGRRTGGPTLGAAGSHRSRCRLHRCRVPHIGCHDTTVGTFVRDIETVNITVVRTRTIAKSLGEKCRRDSWWWRWWRMQTSMHVPKMCVSRPCWAMSNCRR